MKQLIKTNKGFSIIFVAELLYLVILIMISIGHPVKIHLAANQLEIYDEKATIQKYNPAQPMALDANTLVVYDNKNNIGSEYSLNITGRNDEEPYGRWIAGSDLLTVSPGMYELEVKYYSLLYNNEVGGNSDDRTGTIQIISEKKQNKILYNELPLRDGITVNSTRVWIRSLKDIDDLQLKVAFSGLGDLNIESISLTELPFWRILKIIACIILFGFVDIVYIYCFTENSNHNKGIVLGLISIIFFSSLPLFEDYLLKGHDMDFHIARIWALAENIKAGQWVFPIQTEMVNGYGYASPLFYGQLFLYIPAIIYIMGAPIMVSYQIYAFLINVVTALISYFCFKGMMGNKKIALLGSFLYTLSAYRIVNMYLRAATGEYTAMVFYPLLVYGFAKIYQTEADKIKWKDCICVVIGLTGLIQSHILSCEMTAIFIILFCLIHIRKTFELKRLCRLLETVLFTLGLNLAFILPMLMSMTMNVRVRTQETDPIQHYGAYLIQILGVFMTSSGDTVDGMQNEMPMALGFALVLGLIMFLRCCVNKYNWKIQDEKMIKTGKTCTVFAVICIIVSLRLFPWDGIEEISPSLAKILSVVQFPWRYLSIATIFAVVSTMVGIQYMLKHDKTIITQSMLIIIISTCLLTAGLFYMNFANSAGEYRVYGGADVEQDTVGGEYMLTDTIEGYTRWRSVIADLSQVGIDQYQSDYGTISFMCVNHSDVLQLVQIPILNYDNYHAYTENREELEIKNGTNNRIGIMIPGNYQGEITVIYKIPTMWKIANLVSMIMFIWLVLSIYQSRVGHIWQPKGKCSGFKENN